MHTQSKQQDYVTSKHDNVRAVFQRNEQILASGTYPTITRFVRAELEFFVSVIHKYKLSQIAELGSGPGRLLQLLEERGITAEGLDNDTASIEVARERGYETEYADVFAPAPDNVKAKYDGILLSVNLLFNFDPADRRKWLEYIHELLQPNGLLLLNNYAYNEITKELIGERVEFYTQVIQPDEGSVVAFGEISGERGVYLKNKEGQVTWFSRWNTEDEFQEFIREHADLFGLTEYEVCAGQLGFMVALKRK